MQILFFILCFLVTPCYPQTPEYTSEAKKKIIVFTSNGGGGHRSASATLTKHLSETYDVHEVNMFSDLLASLDPLRSITFNKYTCEDFYNYLLTNKWTRITNTLCRYGRWATRTQSQKITTLLNDYVDQHKADMLISVVPLVNLPLYHIAEQHNIPFLVLTNDLDTRNYVQGFNEPSYKKFKYTLAFEDKQMKELIQEAGIHEQQFETTGFPLRPDFFEKKSTKDICQSFGLPNNKPKILLIMGATGSHTLYKYTKSLCKINTPLHLVVCLGRNEKLDKKIKALKKNNKVTITTVGFTQRISDLMSVSDLIITKPGPNTICEAIQMNLPMILDNTSNHLFWEKFNLTFVEKSEIGMTIDHFKQTKKIVMKFLQDHVYYNSIKKNLALLCKSNFKTRIKEIVNTMIKL